uniref:Uncharacterized protein n=1 Tax=Physcomitrium patens TaxID=3218 RepID=A0A2K1KUC0_PHYPA|nr:hypothetical protein PHYPA_004362 [Physcomitrium patens]
MSTIPQACAAPGQRHCHGGSVRSSCTGFKLPGECRVKGHMKAWRGSQTNRSQVFVFRASGWRVKAASVPAKLSFFRPRASLLVRFRHASGAWKPSMPASKQEGNKNIDRIESGKLDCTVCRFCRLLLRICTICFLVTSAVGTCL